MNKFGKGQFLWITEKHHIHNCFNINNQVPCTFKQYLTTSQQVNNTQIQNSLVLLLNDDTVEVPICYLQSRFLSNQEVILQYSTSENFIYYSTPTLLKQFIQYSKPKTFINLYNQIFYCKKQLSSYILKYIQTKLKNNQQQEDVGSSSIVSVDQMLKLSINQSQKFKQFNHQNQVIYVDNSNFLQQIIQITCNQKFSLIVSDLIQLLNNIFQNDYILNLTCTETILMKFSYQQNDEYKIRNMNFLLLKQLNHMDKHVLQQFQLALENFFNCQAQQGYNSSILQQLVTDINKILSIIGNQCKEVIYNTFTVYYFKHINNIQFNELLSNQIDIMNDKFYNKSSMDKFNTKQTIININLLTADIIVNDMDTLGINESQLQKASKLIKQFNTNYLLVSINKNSVLLQYDINLLIDILNKSNVLQCYLFSNNDFLAFQREWDEKQMQKQYLDLLYQIIGKIMKEYGQKQLSLQKLSYFKIKDYRTINYERKYDIMDQVISLKLNFGVQNQNTPNQMKSSFSKSYNNQLKSPFLQNKNVISPFISQKMQNIIRSNSYQYKQSLQETLIKFAQDEANYLKHTSKKSPLFSQSRIKRTSDENNKFEIDVKDDAINQLDDQINKENIQEDIYTSQKNSQERIKNTYIKYLSYYDKQNNVNQKPNDIRKHKHHKQDGLSPNKELDLLYQQCENQANMMDIKPQKQQVSMNNQLIEEIDLDKLQKNIGLEQITEEVKTFQQEQLKDDLMLTDHSLETRQLRSLHETENHLQNPMLHKYLYYQAFKENNQQNDTNQIQQQNENQPEQNEEIQQTNKIRISSQQQQQQTKSQISENQEILDTSHDNKQIQNEPQILIDQHNENQVIVSDGKHISQLLENEQIVNNKNYSDANLHSLKPAKTEDFLFRNNEQKLDQINNENSITSNTFVKNISQTHQKLNLQQQNTGEQQERTNNSQDFVCLTNDQILDSKNNQHMMKQPKQNIIKFEDMMISQNENVNQSVNTSIKDQQKQLYQQKLNNEYDQMKDKLKDQVSKEYITRRDSEDQIRNSFIINNRASICTQEQQNNKLRYSFSDIQNDTNLLKQQNTYVFQNQQSVLNDLKNINNKYHNIKQKKFELNVTNKIQTAPQASKELLLNQKVVNIQNQIQENMQGFFRDGLEVVQPSTQFFRGQSVLEGQSQTNQQQQEQQQKQQHMQYQQQQFDNSSFQLNSQRDPTTKVYTADKQDEINCQLKTQQCQKYQIDQMTKVGISSKKDSTYLTEADNIIQKQLDHNENLKEITVSESYQKGQYTELLQQPQTSSKQSSHQQKLTVDVKQPNLQQSNVNNNINYDILKNSQKCCLTKEMLQLDHKHLELLQKVEQNKNNQNDSIQIYESQYNKIIDLPKKDFRNNIHSDSDEETDVNNAEQLNLTQNVRIISKFAKQHSNEQENEKVFPVPPGYLQKQFTTQIEQFGEFDSMALSQIAIQ